MPLSRSRDYLSIGEVIEALRPDFPDVSISKIRFLEAEGLIAPERTGSGYRKFYDDDVKRLRYILSLQRDHFLPLRVIRERLATADADGGVPAVPPAAPQPADGPAASRGAPATSPVATDVQMDRGEFLHATRLSEPQLASLEEFGVLAPRNGTYDGDDLVVGSIARGLLDRGLEPRHLKMYRQFAEREAAFFEQMVGPVAQRKDPDRRRDAVESIADLAALGSRLHDAALRSTLRELL